MCNADNVSDDPNDLNGHDVGKHSEAGGGEEQESGEQ